MEEKGKEREMEGREGKGEKRGDMKGKEKKGKGRESLP